MFKWRFLLSFTQLSTWRNNFLNNGFTPTILSIGLNAFKQWELPCTIYWKNVFWGSNSIKTHDSLTCSFSSLQNRHRKDPIVKLGSLGKSSLEYWTKASSPWPWTIILVNVTSNCLNLYTILFFNWSWRKNVLKWSILSSITHKKSSLDCIDSIP